MGCATQKQEKPTRNPQLTMDDRKPPDDMPLVKKITKINTPSRLVPKQKSNNFIKDKYIMGDIIDMHNFGKLEMVIRMDNRERRVLRTIFKIPLQGPQTKCEKSKRAKFLAQIDILKNLSHPHICQIFERGKDDENLYIVEEYWEGGSVLEHFSEFESMDERIAHSVINQVLRAIYFCHEKGIIHLNLSPSQIMISKNENESNEISIRLKGWGLYNLFDLNQMICSSHQTLYFAAPELFSNDIGHQSDMWSIGALLYFFLSGRPAFDRNDRKATIQATEYDEVVFGEAFQSVSEDAKDLILQLMNRNLEDRLTAEQAMKHPWINPNYKRKYTATLKPALENMMKFQKSNKLYVATVAYMAKQLVTQKELNKLSKMFDQIDTNGNGIITKDELRNAFMVVMGDEYNQELFDQTLENIDIEHTGVISYDAFITLTSQRTELINQKNLKKVFFEFDHDQSGFIRVDELRYIFDHHNVEPQVWHKLIERLLGNKEHDKISFEQFREMMEKLKWQ